MAVQAQEDAFHEIQLNGKQLVFVFMVATVASVVIFLCGVFVGRGVRAERAGSDEAASLIEAAAADVAPAKSAALSPPAQGADPRAATPPSATDDQSYVDRLEKKTPPTEDLKQAPSPPPLAETKPAPPSKPGPSASTNRTALPESQPAPASTPSRAPAPAQAAPAQAAPAQAASAQGATAQGFVVQVAALNARSEADAIVKKLVSKGYAAFVQPPVSGSPTVFRVRVGPFPTRQAADALASKLQKEEQYKPWVTR